MLEPLIYPQAIAVLGASRNPGKVGHAFVANLLRSGYQGKIIPVNPEASDILGVKCYRTLEEAGVQIDLSIVVVPPRFVKDAIQSSIKSGAKVVTVIYRGVQGSRCGRRSSGGGVGGTVRFRRCPFDGAKHVGMELVSMVTATMRMWRCAVTRRAPG